MTAKCHYYLYKWHHQTVPQLFRTLLSFLERPTIFKGLSVRLTTIDLELTQLLKNCALLRGTVKISLRLPLSISGYSLASVIQMAQLLKAIYRHQRASFWEFHRSNYVYV